ncbi:MAG TPA: 3-hydroxyacyl-CoA dehydrogenase family protein [Syntrophomonadaceae bacterium]|nr:3-hydroxyacyl-CoA dehydrogenase family protein [Syntrophomonadaceae bacterium]
METADVKTICVVGAGNMGHQIALQCALCGFTVWCNDRNEETLNKAHAFADKWLAGRVGKGKMGQDEADAVKARLNFTGDLKKAASGADLVIEAIVEILNVKKELFKQLDEICPPHTIFASNSSYIVSSRFAQVTKRPEKVLNMHFFNPALVMKLVEVVQGPHVSDETVDVVMGVARAINKVPTRVNKEIYGFVANRIFSAITKEACYLLDQQVASIEDIDNAVRNGLGHPMGPLELLDLTGIDLEYNVLMERYRQTGDVADKPSPAIVERYTQGNYGRKTGKGFYEYKPK